jgi:hypothetical protein
MKADVSMKATGTDPAATSTTIIDGTAIGALAITIVITTSWRIAADESPLR